MICCRKTRISASNAARGRIRSTTIEKIILQRSNIPQRIIRFCVSRQLHGIYDRDRSSVVVAVPAPTTRDKDELSVSCNTKVGDSYCSLSPARPFIETSTDLSEELPKKRRRTEVSVPIGSHGAHRQAQFQMSTLVRTAGAIRTRIVHIRAPVARAPWPSGPSTARSKRNARAGSRP
jgi:hypothetical protein